jgi:DNA-directed RNA polymerase subunit M
MFCPKCGSILLPKKDGTKKILYCSCGFKNRNPSEARICEKVESSGEEVAVVDKDPQPLPIVDADCPKCKHKKAYYWLVQTRSGDEPETKFLKCEKCSHTWRDYT